MVGLDVLFDVTLPLLPTRAYDAAGAIRRWLSLKRIGSFGVQSEMDRKSSQRANSIARSAAFLVRMSMRNSTCDLSEGIRAARSALVLNV